MASYYTLGSICNLISKYEGWGGQATTLEEGVLGVGLVVLHSAPGKKSCVIRERYVNAWKSMHTIRFYNVLPAKYAKAIERVENVCDEEID